MKKKPVKEVKMHKFLVCLYKYQDFAQSQKNFARSHDCETVTFRNSVVFYQQGYSVWLYNLFLIFCLIKSAFGIVS